MATAQVVGEAMHDSWATDGLAPRTDGRTPTRLPGERAEGTIAWYIVQTKPHKEASVERFLRGMVADVFLPRIVERVRAGRTMQRRVSPMFPSYLFACLHIDSLGKTIRYTQGVRDFVRFGGHAQPVAPDIVDAIRTRVGPRGVFEPPPARFHPGDRLQINAGPLRGLEVVFEREINGRERVAVLLAEVQLAARVILESTALSKT
ncbi:MAG: transcription termination/antitermination NusG family protein [Candidatus Binatia bacterium]